MREAGYRLGPVVVNRVHPRPAEIPAAPFDAADGRQLLAWLGERDARGVAELRELLGTPRPVEIPLLSREPTDLPALSRLAGMLEAALAGAEASHG